MSKCKRRQAEQKHQNKEAGFTESTYCDPQGEKLIFVWNQMP